MSGRMQRMFQAAVGLLVSASTSLLLAADRPGDWPQILGRQRDGVYDGPPIAADFAKSPPRVLWKHPVGEGYAGAAVSDGGLVVYHRIDKQEVAERLDALTGQPKWKTETPTAYIDGFGFDNGPRATPTIQDGRVYLFGAEGRLSCLDFESGKSLWSTPLGKSLDADQGYFGFACSPVVEEGRVLVNVGGKKGAGLVAVDAQSGEIAWRNVEDQASYSSPVVRTIAGRKHAVFFTRTGLVDVDPATGNVLHQHRWRARIAASVNAATPIVVGDEIFLSSCYNVGATLLKVDGDKLATIWANDESMSNHFATCVYRQGYLYGLHGRQEEGPTLRCIEWKTGKVMWSDAGGKAGSVLLAGDVLLVLYENGTLRAAQATPNGLKDLGDADVLTGVVRALPALAQGILYARDDKNLIAVDLRPR